ncbi:MAG TPA: TIM barrel protein, partial [Saprospiraceae bacterium]|nr:TIM barrel protein [Saprospiraceae bacterium]
MNRRDFVKNAVAVSAALPDAVTATPATAPAPAPATATTPATAPAFQMNFAPHDGMFRNHAGEDFLEQIKFMHEQGFRSIEDNGMMGREPALQTKIGDLLAQLGMDMGVFVIAYDAWPFANGLTQGKAEIMDKWLRTCREAIEVAKRCHAKWMTVVPGTYFPEISQPYQTANVVDALRRAADMFAPQGLAMVLEPLSDRPDLFLRRSDQTFEICKAVNSPACKILYDIYHMQRNEGNLMNHIDQAWDEIAYYQIGDNPGRKEPTTGEIN